MVVTHHPLRRHRIASHVLFVTLPVIVVVVVVVVVASRYARASTSVVGAELCTTAPRARGLGGGCFANRDSKHVVMIGRCVSLWFSKLDVALGPRATAVVTLASAADAADDDDGDDDDADDVFTVVAARDGDDGRGQGGAPRSRGGGDRGAAVGGGG